jgi:hypothetical protein
VSAGLVIDPGRAEVSGPAREVRALLEPDGPALPEGPPAPLLEAGLAAAREPVARLRVTGLPEELEGFAAAGAGALLLPRDGGRLALRACTPSGLLGLLVRAVGLRPRPRHAGGIVLPAAALARALHERDATAAPADDATRARLQAHLDALEGHWRIELHGPDAGWYLEVLDSAAGLWTVEDRPDGAVALAATDATRVLDELAALPGHAGLG